ncbi:MAG: DMT family transporter [Lachnospiraceae bacterium]|nr:DMT family transporter [Lachnospiraceae bacterium]
MAVSKRRAEYLSYAGFLSIAIVWGVAFVIVKNSLDYIPPVYLLALRFTIAGGLLFLFTIRRTFEAIRNNREILIHGLIIGVILYLSYLAQTIGLVYTTAGKNAFLTAVYVVMVPFVHWIRVKKRPEKLCFIAAFIAIAGIGLITLDGDMTVNRGDLLTLLCGVLFSLQIEYIGKYSRIEDPIVISMLMMATAAVVSWITAPFFDGPVSNIVFNRESVGGLLYLAVLSTMVCFVIQSVCQRYVKSSVAAIIMSAEAVFGAVSSAVILGERMSAKVIAGCVLLFAAIILAQLDTE